MTAQLTLKDETTSGKVVYQMVLQIPQNIITVRDLIATRVKEEIQRVRKDNTISQYALVKPKWFNKEHKNIPKPIDEQAQIKKAIEAFNTSQLIILFDDRQLEDLNEQLSITDDSLVTFLKLVPLVGG